MAAPAPKLLRTPAAPVRAPPAPVRAASGTARQGGAQANRLLRPSEPSTTTPAAAAPAGAALQAPSAEQTGPISDETRAAMARDVDRIVKILKFLIVETGDQITVVEIVKKYLKLDEELHSGDTPHLDQFLFMLKIRTFQRRALRTLGIAVHAIAYDAIWHRLSGGWRADFKRIVMRSRKQGTPGPSEDDVDNYAAKLAQQEAMGMWGALKGLGTSLAGVAGPKVSQELAAQFDEAARILFGHEWDAAEPLFLGMNAGQIGTVGGDVIWQLAMFGRGAGAKGGKILEIAAKLDQLRKAQQALGVLGGLQGIGLAAQGIARVIERRQKAGQPLTALALSDDPEFVGHVVGLLASALGTAMAARGSPEGASKVTAARVKLLLVGKDLVTSMHDLVHVAQSSMSAGEKEREYGRVMTTLIPQLVSAVLGGAEYRKEQKTESAARGAGAQQQTAPQKQSDDTAAKPPGDKEGTQSPLAAKLPGPGQDGSGSGGGAGKSADKNEQQSWNKETAYAELEKIRARIAAGKPAPASEALPTLDPKKENTRTQFEELGATLKQAPLDSPDLPARYTVQEPLVAVRVEGGGSGKKGRYVLEGTKEFKAATKGSGRRARTNEEYVVLPRSQADSLGFKPREPAPPKPASTKGAKKGKGSTPAPAQPIKPAVIGGKQVESSGAGRRHNISGRTETSQAQGKKADAFNRIITADLAQAHGYKTLLASGEIGLLRPGNISTPGVDAITVKIEGGKARIFLNDVTTPGVVKNEKPSHQKWVRELAAAIKGNRLDVGDPAANAAILKAFEDGEVYVRTVRVDSEKHAVSFQSSTAAEVKKANPNLDAKSLAKAQANAVEKVSVPKPLKKAVRASHV